MTVLSFSSFSNGHMLDSIRKSRWICKLCCSHVLRLATWIWSAEPRCTSKIWLYAFMQGSETSAQKQGVPWINELTKLRSSNSRVNFRSNKFRPNIFCIFCWIRPLHLVSKYQSKQSCVRISKCDWMMQVICWPNHGVGARDSTASKKENMINTAFLYTFSFFNIKFWGKCGFETWFQRCNTFHPPDVNKGRVMTKSHQIHICIFTWFAKSSMVYFGQNLIWTRNGESTWKQRQRWIPNTKCPGKLSVRIHCLSTCDVFWKL